MANQLPDFSYKGPDLLEMYKFKVQQQNYVQAKEDEKKNLRFQQLNQAFQAGASVVDSITTANKMKQMKDAQDALIGLLGKGADKVPTTPTQWSQETEPNALSMNPAGFDAMVQPQAQPAAPATQEYSKTPEYKARLAQLVTRAFPEQAGKEAAEAAFAQLNPDKNFGAEARKTGIRDTLVRMPDGSEVSKLIGFDENGAYNPMTMERITSSEQMQGLPERSYTMQGYEDASGSVKMVPKSRTGTVSTAAPTIKEEDYGTITNVRKLQRKDSEAALDMLTKAKDDQIIKNAKATIVTLTNVEKMLASNNKIAIDRLGGLTQKLVALDSGNLAAWEQRDPNARDYISRIKQYITMSAKGELTPEAKAEFMDLIAITKQNLLENMNSAADYHIDGMTTAFPQLNRDAMKQQIGLEGYNKLLGSKAAPKGSNIDPGLDAIAKTLGLKKRRP